MIEASHPVITLPSIITLCALFCSFACAITYLVTHRLCTTAAQTKTNALKQALDQAKQDNTSSQHENTRLVTQLEEREKNFASTQNQMKLEFKVLADRIFEERAKKLSETNQTTLNALVNPLKQQIEQFQKRSNEIHSESLKGKASLESEIRKLLETGLSMSREANALTTALKGEKKTLGNWGEMQLETALESAGLVAGEHYQAQSAFKDEEGKIKYPDFVIQLPDKKQIVIDSKVSLNDYANAVSAGSDTPAGQAALQAHFQATKNHIDSLAKKDYSKLIGINSPSFVLMFVPVEPAYVELLKQNYELFNYGYKKSIILVSYTTLLPILRTIANLWMLDKSNKEAQEVSKKAGDIYNQVCSLAEHLLKLGNSLGTVSNHYNRSVRALVGQQGLYKKVERFNQLSSHATKTLPTVEPLEIDLEDERLALVVEPSDP